MPFCIIFCSSLTFHVFICHFMSFFALYVYPCLLQFPLPFVPLPSPFMFFHALLHHFLPFHVLPCSPMSFMPFLVLSCCLLPSFGPPCPLSSLHFHVLPCLFMPFHVILCHFMSPCPVVCFHDLLCLIISFSANLWSSFPFLVLCCYFMSILDLSCPSLSSFSPPFTQLEWRCSAAHISSSEAMLFAQSGAYDASWLQWLTLTFHSIGSMLSFSEFQ